MTGNPPPEDDINADIRMEAEDENIQQKLINEEYKIWKKNSAFLYDFLYGRALEWPSLSCQWFPDVKQVPNSQLREHRILLGTNTSGKGKEYLQIAKLEIPEFVPPQPGDYNPETSEIGGYGHARKAFQWQIVQKFNHPGEVNKAKYMPQNPDIIASMAPYGRVLIFDRTKHPLQPKDDQVLPQIELKGHAEEGFGLCWSPFNEGQLVTGSEDKTVRLWDITAATPSTSSAHQCKTMWKNHRAIVNDVDFHRSHSFLIGSVSDDRTLQIIDTRRQPDKAVTQMVIAHAEEVNCLAFHPKYEFLVATGSADASVAIWDQRYLKKKLNSITVHKDSVISLEWHPHEPSILGSASYDRRIAILDMTKTGEEQTEEEAQEGPPELLFLHGGFTNRVCDFSWNPNDPWVMFASADDNQIQCFRPARSLVNMPVETNITMRDVQD